MDANPSVEPPTSAGAMITTHRHGTTGIFGGTFTSYHTTHVNPGPGSAHAWQQLSQRVADAAIHTSEAVERQDMCLEGTRTTVLEALGAFLTAPVTDTPPVLWMTGPAGAGKSAIMRTIARTPAPNVVILASFFFFKADGRRNSHHALVPTIAFQMVRSLSKYIPDIRARVEAVIDNDPTLFSQSGQRQGEAFIVSVLSGGIEAHPTSIPNNTSFAILVDGLDECSGEDHQVEVIDALVNTVAQVNRQAGLQLKLIIASRPEPHIDGAFREMEEEGTVRILKLDKSFNPDADVQLFYDVHFARIRRTHPLSRTLRLGPDWPSAEVKAILTHKASGHFSFPDTIIKFTKDPRGHPVERLQMVLDNTSPDDSLQPFAALDHLYNTIFSTIPSYLLPSALQAMGALLAPPEINVVHSDARMLALFLHIPLDQLAHIFLFLTSLFEWKVVPSPTHDDFFQISVYHASLADFLFTQSRSEQFGLFIDLRTFAQAALLNLFSPFSSSDADVWNDDRLPRSLVLIAEYILPLLDYANATPESLIQALVDINPADTTPSSLAYLTIIDFRIHQEVDFDDQSLYAGFKSELKAQLHRRTSAYLDSDAGRLSIALLFYSYSTDPSLSPSDKLMAWKRCATLLSHDLKPQGPALFRHICSCLQSEQLKILDKTGWNMLDPDCRIFYWATFFLWMDIQFQEDDPENICTYLGEFTGFQESDFIDISRYLLRADTQATIATHPKSRAVLSSLFPWYPEIPEASPTGHDVAYLCLRIVSEWVDRRIINTREAFLSVWPLVLDILNEYPDDGYASYDLAAWSAFAEDVLLLEEDHALLTDVKERVALSYRLRSQWDSSMPEGLRGLGIQGEDAEEEVEHWEDAEEGDGEE